jgi:hypothetical protein
VSSFPTETFETQSYGLGYPQPYPFGIPEVLPRNATSLALENSHVVFSGQGRVLGLTVSSTRGSGQFFQLFDATALPANGAIPLISVDIASVTAKGVAFDPYGRWFDRGCVIANSTTQGSLTVGSADCLFDVQYIPQVI